MSYKLLIRLQFCLLIPSSDWIQSGVKWPGLWWRCCWCLVMWSYPLCANSRLSPIWWYKPFVIVSKGKLLEHVQVCMHDYVLHSLSKIYKRLNIHFPKISVFFSWSSKRTFWVRDSSLLAHGSYPKCISNRGRVTFLLSLNVCTVRTIFDRSIKLAKL